LQDGDEILVHMGRDRSLSTVAAFGAVRFPGGYPWKTGMTAEDLLRLAGGPNDSAFEGRVLVKRTDSTGRMLALRAPLVSCGSLLLAGGDSLVVFNRRLMSDTDSVLISGAVRRPGPYLFLEGMTVKDLILEAGGFLPSAEFGRIRLEEGQKDSAMATTTWLALDSSLDALAADTPLDPGQHLAVPWNPRWYEPEAVTLRGWVARPGLYFLKRPGERLSSVLERAGGVKAGGYTRAAVFVRGRDSVGRVQVDLEKALAKPGSTWDVPLRGADTLTIPDQPATIRVAGYVNYPTSIMWEKGRSWSWYIARAGGYADSADAAKVWVRYADGSILSRDYGLADPDPGSEIVVPKAPPPEKMKTAEKVAVFGSLASTLLTVVTVMILLRQN
jgi:protein involved in polysaccharide export with SLBB domain